MAITSSEVGKRPVAGSIMPRRKPNGSNQARPENWPESRQRARASPPGSGVVTSRSTPTARPLGLAGDLRIDAVELLLVDRQHRRQDRRDPFLGAEAHRVLGAGERLEQRRV